MLLLQKLDEGEELRVLRWVPRATSVEYSQDSLRVCGEIRSQVGDKERRLHPLEASLIAVRVLRVNIGGALPVVLLGDETGGRRLGFDPVVVLCPQLQGRGLRVEISSPGIE